MDYPRDESKVKIFSVSLHEMIEKILIAPFGADKSLIQSECFLNIITLNEIFP